MSAMGRSRFGWAACVSERPAPCTADDRAEGRLALTFLTAALACIYAISGASMVGRSPGTGVALVMVAGVQAGWLALADIRGRLLMAGTLLNLALVAIWVLSRAVGVPGLPGGPQPVGVLDALCAFDSLVVASLASALRDRPSHRSTRLLQPLTHCGIVLSVASLSAFAGGHTQHADVGSPASAGPHTYYCRLL